MTSTTHELEGTWEEILAHAEDLAGRRVRLIVLPAEPAVETASPPLSPANQRMLDLLDEWEQNPLTDEEQSVLDGLEQHLREHLFSLRQVEAEGATLVTNNVRHFEGLGLTVENWRA